MFSTIPPLQMQALDSSETGKAWSPRAISLPLTSAMPLAPGLRGLLFTAGVSPSHIPWPVHA
ncbi:hypothetical protein LNO81_12525 [Klebsiella variicola subsp. variicola]|nr:hypothetical protein [Klebsiella variicola subsp. variicola]